VNSNDKQNHQKSTTFLSQPKTTCKVPHNYIVFIAKRFWPSIFLVEISNKSSRCREQTRHV